MDCPTRDCMSPEGKFLPRGCLTSQTQPRTPYLLQQLASHARLQIIQEAPRAAKNARQGFASAMRRTRAEERAAGTAIRNAALPSRQAGCQQITVKSPCQFAAHLSLSLSSLCVFLDSQPPPGLFSITLRLTKAGDLRLYIRFDKQQEIKKLQFGNSDRIVWRWSKRL